MQQQEGETDLSPNIVSHVSSFSSPTLRMRSLNDIYAETTPIEYDDELEMNLLCLYANHEPLSFKEENNSESWKIAIKEEIRALEKNDTWVLTSLPPQQ